MFNCCFLNHLFYIYAGEIKKTSQRTASSMNWPKGAKAQEVANIMDLRIAKKATLYYKEMLRKIADAT
jgi:hypothetical protein